MVSLIRTKSCAYCFSFNKLVAASTVTMYRELADAHRGSWNAYATTSPAWHLTQPAHQQHHCHSIAYSNYKWSERCSAQTLLSQSSSKLQQRLMVRYGFWNATETSKAILPSAAKLPNTSNKGSGASKHSHHTTNELQSRVRNNQWRGKRATAIDSISVIRVFLRRFMSPKRSQKFLVRTHRIGTLTLNLDNYENF